MFDSFYITNSQKYVFNKETGLMFKVSSNMAKVLCKFQGENDLKEKDPSLFTEIEPYLIKLKQDIALSAIESKQNSISLQLIMCTMCNLSCKYCYAHAGTYNQEQAKMSLNVVKKALDIFLSKYDFIDVLTFFGGEPLLCIDEIEKICEYIEINYSDRVKMFGMMSNLYNLTEEAIEIIKKYKIRVGTSLDGNKYLNQYRCSFSGENSYDQVVRNIQKLHHLTGEPTTVEVTMTNLHNEFNCDPISLMNILTEITPVKAFTINSVSDFNGKMKPYLYEDKGNIISLGECLDYFLNTGSYNMYINDLVGIMTHNNAGNILCDAGKTKFTIMPNGNIYPCHLYCLDDTDNFCLGNIYNFSNEVFEKAQVKINIYNSKNTYDRCKNCYAKRICTSCMGSKYINKMSQPHDEEFCLKQQEYLNTLIELYAELLENTEKLNLFKKRLKEQKSLCQICCD